MKSVYLDYAAATPVDESVLAAMQPYYTEKFHNPSSVYLASRAVRHDLADYRQKAAGILGVKASEIIFTAGASEANNLAIRGIMQAYPDKQCIVSSIEHESVLEPAKKYDYQLLPVDDCGRVSIADLQKRIHDDVVLVSIMYANNEIGTVQDINNIARYLHEVRRERQEKGISVPLYFHMDGVQAAQFLDLDAGKLGVDLMTLSAGKIYGPKMSGLLYVGAGIQLEPQILGGGQEHNARSGTVSLASVAGMARALNLVQGRRKDIHRQLAGMKSYMIQSLTRELPNLQVNGHKKHSLPNIVSISLPGMDGERAVMMLDERGVQCATGSACSALSDESSYVIKALGNDEVTARGTLRLSLGAYTIQPDIEYATGHILEVIRELS